MTTAALLLVLSSGVLHASWNFLVKRSGHKVVFFWVMAAVGLPIVAGPAVYFAVRDDFGWTQLGYCAVTSTLHALYAIFLTRGYYLGDLSSVYPVSRGIGPAFVPVLAVIFLDESVSAEAIVGIGLVVAGILAIQVDRRLLADLSHPFKALTAPAMRVAIATGIIISSYSLWDKAGLNHDVAPLTLLEFTIIGNFVGLLPAMLWGLEPGTLRREWANHRQSMIAAGLLAPLGYALVLIALNTSKVSYIAPSREVGIVFGTAAGVLLLGEGYGLSRIWGSVLVVAGVVVLAVAP
jgi:uncharacterized membrane protein